MSHTIRYEAIKGSFRSGVVSESWTEVNWDLRDTMLLQQLTVLENGQPKLWAIRDQRKDQADRRAKDKPADKCLA